MTHQDYDDPHRLASAAVVVGVDGSAGSDLALRWAADYAARYDRSLMIAHGLELAGPGTVFGGYEVVVSPLVDAVSAEGRALLAAAEESVRKMYPDLRVSQKQTADTAAELLVDLSAAANVVVLGATGSVGAIGHLGSTLLAVTAHAQGSVVVVRPEAEGGNVIRESGPVVVGIDGSAVSEAAIGAAFAEASVRRTGLVAVHVWSDWTAGRFAGAKPPVALGDLDGIEEAVLAERLAGWQEKYPDVEVTRRLYLSGPADRLQHWSNSAQLVVIGNRGRGGFLGLLLGSTAHSLVQHAHCPVMVVHATHRAAGQGAATTGSIRNTG